MIDGIAPTRRRRLALACTLVLAALAPIDPAAAGEVWAKSDTVIHDLERDVPYCKADITYASADWNDDRVSFQIGTACGMDITVDPTWIDGTTGLGFLIDTNDDGAVDYVAAYSYTEPGLLYDARDVVVCEGNARHPASHIYAIEFSAGCLPGPFTFVGVMVLDENPHGSTCTCPEDYAPDDTFTFPVYRGPRPPEEGQGYWMLGRDGAVYAFGDADVYDAPELPPDAVDIEPTVSGRGYWLVNEAGDVRFHGDAFHRGEAGPLHPTESVTAISRSGNRAGYWMFTNLGRVLAFGDAAFLGDMSSMKLNGPVLDAIPTPSGNGYYMVGSDGGIFTFGDAVFRGSMGSIPLNAPVQSLVPDPDGVGYWLVASDGGIFAFDAEFYGSMGSTKLNQPVTGMVGFGRGYLMVAEDGGIFTFGEAPFLGSLGDDPPEEPIVATAVLNQ